MDYLIPVAIFLGGLACGLYLMKVLFFRRLGSATILMDSLLSDRVQSGNYYEEASVERKMDLIRQEQTKMIILLNSIIRDENQHF